MEVNNIIDWNSLTPTQQVQRTIQANNSWSAAQAQAQMDFQREMSNTAHQREVADLKAAGLNPVLSAKLGGASTPSGAMGTTDTSGTQALVDLLALSIQATNSAASAAQGAVQAKQSGNGKILGIDPLSLLFNNPRTPGQMGWNTAMYMLSNYLGDKELTMTDIMTFYNNFKNRNSNSGKTVDGTSGASFVPPYQNGTITYG